MRGLKKKRRIQIIIIAAVLLAGASVLIGYGLRDGINFFRTPTEVAETAPPSDEDLFGEGQGTIATGTYQDGVFLATELLARHDETYMPVEVIDALEEQGVYRTSEGS